MAMSGPTTDHWEIRSWAEKHNAVPAEVLPHLLDGEPATLRILAKEAVRDHTDVKLITWDEFFVKFDQLGLTFVYDDETAGSHEILQVEERNPYRHPKQKVQSGKN